VVRPGFYLPRYITAGEQHTPNLDLHSSINCSPPILSLMMIAPRAKRQKVAIACDPCRIRKIKCNGIQPVCEPCSKKRSNALQCTWATASDRQSFLPPGQTGASTSSVAAQRPQPELPVAQYTSAFEAAQPYFQSPSFSRTSQSPFESRAGPLLDSSTRQVDQSNTALNEPLSTPAVHAIIGATQDEDAGEGYFGTSSAGTFMQSVKRLVQQKIHGVPANIDSARYAHIRSPPSSGHPTVQSKPVEYVLPSRRRADLLMSCYWTYVHVLYPYLDKTQMEQDYEKLWRADGSIDDERSFMCLINVIFALSSQIDESTPLADRQDSASVFYLRAKELLDIFDTGSVRWVQSLLLLGQYHQSTSEPHPCWIFTGLAIRTAQSLGLQLPETSEAIADTRSRELLRKVWHGCILMDRVVSAAYGRPPMIGPKAALAVPLPLPVDEDYLGAAVGQQINVSTQQTHSVEFFVLSLRLYDVMHDVIFNFYSVNGQACQWTDDNNSTFLGLGDHSVLEVERRLARWTEVVPGHLLYPSTEKPRTNAPEAILHRQAVVLHQR
jgi:hypothetical protein